LAVVLIVEDEKEMARGLKDLLEYEHQAVHLAPDGQTALQLFQKHSPDLVLLDLMLPDMDGLDVCRAIRKTHPRTPILMLTARSMEHDIIRGFEAGVDDYVTKPFSVAQLLARVKALLRRTQPSTQSTHQIRIGANFVDIDKFLLRRGTEEIPLTFYEVEILKLLSAHQNEPVHRDTIFRKVWSMTSDPTNRTVDNFIVKLRKKIEDDQKKPQHLITVYGLGYKLVP